MIEKYWQSAVDAIDCKISAEVKKWEKLLPRPVDSLPKFINLQKHLMYVIMSFLNEESQDGRVQELFIQIPVVEFANKRNDNDNLQNETFRKLIATVASCALLSTRDVVKGNMLISNDNLDWFSEGTSYLSRHPKYCDRILICEKAERWPQITKEADGTRGQVEVPNGLKDGLILYYENGKRPSIVSNQYLKECELFRLKGQSNRVGRISDEINNLKKVFDLPKSRQYKNAKIVTIGRYLPQNDDLHYPIRSNYFDTVVFETDIKKINQNTKTDIIIVIGDDRYKNRDHQRFLRRAAKKIIFVGSEMPYESLKEHTYPLTFRELYRYCAPNNRLMFTEPTFVEDIQFPWMEEKMTELNNLIGQLCETDDELAESQEDIMECFRRIFSNMDFCLERWNQKKQNIDNILKDVIQGVCSIESFNAIKNWAYELQAPRTNAKAQCAINSILSISRFDSYIKKVKALSDYGNTIAIDCASYSPSVGNAMFQAYRDVISHHFFANVIALYYSHERNYANRLRWYLAKELDYYQNPLREKYGTNVKVDVAQDNVPSSLDDIEFNWDDDMGSWWSSDNKTIKLTFTDGSDAIVDGDVLIVIGEDEYEKKSSSELSHYKGKTIYYYVQPDHFDEFKSAFELQEQVQTYSDKWKSALRQYRDINVQRGIDCETIIQQIEKNTRIKQSIFMKYMDEHCTNMFLKNKGHMKRMCNLLLEKGLLTADDVSHIGKAQKAHFTKNSKLGKTIKEEAFLIKMCGFEEAERKTIPTISLIADRLKMGVDEIVDSCLRCGVIQDINNKKLD